MVFVLIVNALLAWNVSGDKYDDDYSKFLKRNFGQNDEKHLDKTAAYKEAQKAAADDSDDYSDEKSASRHDDEEEDDDKEVEDTKKASNDDDSNDAWYYNGRQDYERIKALSERQVEKLTQTPGNCKFYEKDGMTCATCTDPKSGDNSESCSYASKPKDNKIAFLSKKSHNYKMPKAVEADEPESDDAGSDEEEEEEEVAVHLPSGPKPVKSSKSESEEAEFGAFRLAGNNDDVDDDHAPKFEQLKAQPDFEILPENNFKPRDVSQAYTDFSSKDWKNCNKIMKGDMTCYYCKDQKGAVQEECMFISASNPKSYKVERSETKSYDNTKKPTATTKKPFTAFKKPIVVAPSVRSESIKAAPVTSDQKVRFARMRIGRPLLPTKSSKSTAEPLVTPTTNLSPVNHGDSQNLENKKTIKRTVSWNYSGNDPFGSDENRAMGFESHVHHFK